MLGTAQKCHFLPIMHSSSLLSFNPGFVGMLLGRGVAGMTSLERAGPLGVLQGVTQGIKGT